MVAALLLDPENRGADWREWLANLTLTELYRHHLLSSSLTQMWSLCTEVAFYLLLPLLCLLVVRGGRNATGLHLPTVYWRAGFLALLGLGWQVLVAQLPGRQGHYAQWLPGYLPWFLVGVCFAALSASLAVDPRPHPVERMGHDLVGCWLLAGAVFAIACSPVAGPRTLLTPGGWEAGDQAGALHRRRRVLPAARWSSARSATAGREPG